MAQIGDLTGRSMADVAAAIGQTLAGNNARNMHDTRKYKDQYGAPDNLHQWSYYDPNPYVPPPAHYNRLWLQNTSTFRIYGFVLRYNDGGTIKTYTGSSVGPEGYSFDSLYAGEWIELISISGYYDQDRTSPIPSSATMVESGRISYRPGVDYVYPQCGVWY